MNKMNLRRPICALMVLLLALSNGCALRPRDKTVVLPTPAREESGDAQEQGVDWTVRKIRQYEYTTRAVGLDPYTASIGWSEGDLFTVTGAPGEEVAILRVDPRYGFYEECASLGALDYNRLLLSPDGAYALYDSAAEDGQRLRLTLYDVKEGKAHVIADYPNPAPYLMLDFLWSADGRYFFYWLTVNSNDRLYSAEKERYGEIPDLGYYLETIYRSGLPLTSIFRCQADTRRLRTVLDLKGEMDADMEYVLKTQDYFPSCYKTALITRDGGKLLALYQRDQRSVLSLVDCETGAYLDQERASYTHMLERSAVLSRQVTDQYLCGIDLSGDKYIPFVSSGGRIIYLTALTRESDLTFQLTPDEKHIITVEQSADGACGIYLYQFLPDAAAPVSGRRLLYQTTRSVYDVIITPDQKQILICAKNGGMENAAFIWEEYPQNVYTITVLEL
jgi:hypothetical protein